MPRSLPPVRRASSLLLPLPAETSLWDGERVQGRLIEVSEAGFFGALSVVTGLMHQVQGRGELVAWVASGNSVFFPGDLVARGLDVEALPVLFLPHGQAALQAADLLLRSGAFGLLVVDGAGEALSESVLGRLAKVAEDRQTTLVFLTRKADTDPSLASQVSLRVAVRREADHTAWRVVKDKRSGRIPPQRERFHGPLGLY